MLTNSKQPISILTIVFIVISNTASKPQYKKYMNETILYSGILRSKILRRVVEDNEIQHNELLILTPTKEEKKYIQYIKDFKRKSFRVISWILRTFTFVVPWIIQRNLQSNSAIAALFLLLTVRVRERQSHVAFCIAISLHFLDEEALSATLLIMCSPQEGASNSDGNNMRKTLRGHLISISSNIQK